MEYKHTEYTYGYFQVKINKAASICSEVLERLSRQEHKCWFSLTDLMYKLKLTLCNMHELKKQTSSGRMWITWKNTKLDDSGNRSTNKKQ